MTHTEVSRRQSDEAVMLCNRTTIMFQLGWDDEPRETLRMRCLQYEDESGQWVLYILPNVEELHSGWWRLYEIDPARVGSEYSINTKISLNHVKRLLELAASKIGIVLEETEPYEKLSIRSLIERVAIHVGSVKERYQPESGRKMVPPKDVLNVDIFRKVDGTLIHLREDPVPFDDTNRRLWLESFRQFQETNRTP